MFPPVLKTVSVGGSEVFLRSHDGGRKWFAIPREVIEHKRQRERLRVHLRGVFLDRYKWSHWPETWSPPEATPPLSVERELWTAVLLLAALDLRQKNKPRLQKAARGWFNSHMRSPGAFIWVCDVLDLDPETVRRRVLVQALPHERDAEPAALASHTLTALSWHDQDNSRATFPAG